MASLPRLSLHRRQKAQPPVAEEPVVVPPNEQIVNLICELHALAPRVVAASSRGVLAVIAHTLSIDAEFHALARLTEGFDSQQCKAAAEGLLFVCQHITRRTARGGIDDLDMLEIQRAMTDILAAITYWISKIWTV